MEEIDANIMTSAYGRRGFSKFIEDAIKENRILYANKEKCHRLVERNFGLQLPIATLLGGYNQSIAKNTEKVNKNETKNLNNDIAKASQNNISKGVNIMEQNKTETMEQAQTSSEPTVGASDMVYGVDVQELDFEGKATPSPEASAEKQTSQKSDRFMLPKGDSTRKNMYAYLLDKGISKDVIDEAVKSHLLYQEGKYHNCVFVSHNEKGKPVSAQCMGTYTQGEKKPYYGYVAKSDRAEAWSMPCNTESTKLYVFERPTDLMAYRTLYPERATDHMIAVGRIDNKEAIQRYMDRHPNIESIALACNNFGKNKYEASKICDEIMNSGKKAIRLYPHEELTTWTEHCKNTVNNPAQEQAPPQKDDRGPEMGD